MDCKHVVLITGSSTGFGRLIAETLARHGHTVFATMRDPEGRNAINSTEIRALAKRESLPLHVLDLDVTDDASVDRAVRSTVEQAGRIDVAINNAGYGLVGLAEAVTVEQAQRIMNTNFFGSVRVNRAVLPYMRRQRSGLLMHISSGAGRVIIPSFAFYCASKFALEAYAEVLHYELSELGVESVIVEPGPFPTNLLANSPGPADSSRAEGYGSISEIRTIFADTFSKFFASEQSTKPQDVADAIAKLVNIPAGKRPLRTICGPDYGAIAINNHTAPIQAEVLRALGMPAMAKRAAAGD